MLLLGKIQVDWVVGCRLCYLNTSYSYCQHKSYLSSTKNADIDFFVVFE